VDAVWAFVTALATATLIYVFSVVTGAKVERWRDEAGIDPPRRFRRISTARTAAGMALVIYGGGLATGFFILGGPWLVAGAVVLVGGLVAGIVVLKRGPELPAPPAPAPGPSHAGLAYVWHCWLPATMLDFGRVLVFAVIAPVGTAVMLMLGKWVGAAAFAGLGALCWVVLARVKSTSVPRRGPCVRAE
jgi:hypothetical protein